MIFKNISIFFFEKMAASQTSIKNFSPARPYMSMRKAVLAPLEPLSENQNNSTSQPDNFESKNPNLLSLIRPKGHSQSSNLFNLQNSRISHDFRLNKRSIISNNRQSMNLGVLRATIALSESKSQTDKELFVEKSFEKEKENEKKSQEEIDITKMRAPTNRIAVGYNLNGNQNKSHFHLKENNYLMLIEPEVPSIIRICSANFVTRKDVKLQECEPLPKNVSDPEFHKIFLKKIEICEVIFDFTIMNDQITEKEIKTRVLCDFIELFENTREVQNLSEEQQSFIFQMLERNIFEQTPIFPDCFLRVDPYLSIAEPSWPHMFYCFQILNRFIQVFKDSKLININLAKKIINLTQLADTNERMQLVAFLRSYFEYKPDDRVELIKITKNKLIDVKDGVASPLAVMPLIIFILHMCTRGPPTLIPYITDLIKESLLPLISSPWLPLFHQNLNQLLATFISNNKQAANQFLRLIELQWPLRNGSAQYLVLSLLITVWEKMDQSDFKPIAHRVFLFLAECLENSYFRVSALALSIWDGANENSWLGLNSKTAIQVMYEPIQAITEKSLHHEHIHHSGQIKNYSNYYNSEKASRALNEMCRINKAIYQKRKKYIKQLKAQRYKHHVPNDTQRGWVSIARTALINIENSSPEEAQQFDLNSKLKLFHNTFHHERKPTLAVSRFMPVLEKHKKVSSD